MNSLTEASPMKRRASPSALRQFVARLIREQPVRARRRRIVFVLFLFCGVFAHLHGAYGFNEIEPDRAVEAAIAATSSVPGTNNLGRDVLLALPLSAPGCR